MPPMRPRLSIVRPLRLLATWSVLAALTAAALPAHAADPAPKPLVAVRAAYDKLSQDDVESARRLLQGVIGDERARQDRIALSYAYAAMADIEKYLAAGRPLPFDGNRIGDAGNRYEDVVVGPSTPKALEFLSAAEDALLGIRSQATGDDVDFTLSNMWFQLASVYGRVPDKAKLCQALDNSLQSHLTGVRAHPDRPVMLFGRPGSSEQFQKIIDHRKKGSGCAP